MRPRDNSFEIPFPVNGTNYIYQFKIHYLDQKPKDFVPVYYCRY